MGKYTALMQSLRTSFKSDRSKPLSWRREQLQNILRMLEENLPAIKDALKKDLRKSDFETELYELNFIKNEAVDLLNNLEEWTKPEKVKKDMLNMKSNIYIRREPLGVCLVMGAWNYPIQLTLVPVLGAIAAGNCVVMKPSDVAMESGKLLEALIPKYLDQECIRCVNGDIPDTTELLTERFDYIFYTGNTFVGRIIMQAAAKHLTPVTLELGGKSPVYIDESADMLVTAKRLLWGKLINYGQNCISPDYVLCTKSVQEKLIAKMKEAAVEFYGGGEAKDSLSFGRIINDRHFKRLEKLLTSCSGQVVMGGDVDEADKFIEPTVIVDVSPDDPIMKEEIFGPLLPVLTVRGVEEAVDFINQREKPLALYVFSNNKAISQQMINNTSSGGVVVNDCLVHYGVSTLPFGGVGESGIGAYHGKASIDTFSHKKGVLVKGLDMELMNGLRYPPYTEKKLSWVSWILKKSPKKNGLPALAYFLLFGSVLLAVAIKFFGMSEIIMSGITKK